jgi:hypothetical protein
MLTEVVSHLKVSFFNLPPYCPRGTWSPHTRDKEGRSLKLATHVSKPIRDVRSRNLFSSVLLCT